MPALEAAVDDLGPHFRVLAPGDPRLLKGLAGREDGPVDPDRVHALRERDDLDPRFFYFTNYESGLW